MKSPTKCYCQVIYYSLSDATSVHTGKQNNHLGHNLKVLCEGSHEQGCTKLDTGDAVKNKEQRALPMMEEMEGRSPTHRWSHRGRTGRLVSEELNLKT